MKEFTSSITVQLVYYNNTYQFDADPFEFSPQATDDDGGILWDCTQTFVVDTPDDAALREFRYPRVAIVTLKDSHQHSYQVGTREVPARVHLSRHLQKTVLALTCQMLTNPLESEL